MQESPRITTDIPQMYAGIIVSESSIHPVRVADTRLVIVIMFNNVFMVVPPI